MSSLQDRTKAARKFGISQARLMATSALTAASLIGMGMNPAQAQDPSHSWANLDQTRGSFDTTTLDGNVTNIKLNTSRAVGTGNADIYLNHTVNVNGALFAVRDNRADPTRILGNLNSNGQVIVIDNNGVFFGKDARVDVAGIVATTGNVDDDQIMSKPFGNYTFTDVDKGGAIETEEGSVISVAEGGLAAFVAPQIKHSGFIDAKLGQVIFGAAPTVTLDLRGDGLFEIQVDGEIADAVIDSDGTINAEGGRVLMTTAQAKDAVDNLINVDGIVNVASATQQGGKIILSGETVKVSGTLDASSGAGDAGEIDIAANDIEITDQAEIYADGGPFGNGGVIKAIAQQKAIFRGSASARGGELGGEGGFVETSGLEYIDVAGGTVDTRAADGSAGTWLIDPTDITIVIDNPTGSFVPTTNSTVGWIQILTALQTTNVSIATTGGATGNGDIIFDDPSPGPTGFLTINAGNVVQNRTLDFNADHNIVVQSESLTVRNVGTINLNAGNKIVLDSDFTTDDTFVDGVQAGNLNLNADTVDLNANLEVNGGGVLGSTATTVNVLSDNAEIQDGIDIVNAGGDVNVAAGTYNEALEIDKALTLSGANAGTAGYDGARVAESTITAPTAGDALVTVTADDVTIDGFELDGGNIGVHVLGADNTDIVNNHIHGQRNASAQGTDEGGLGTGDGIIVANVAGDNPEETSIQYNWIEDTDDESIQVHKGVNTQILDNKLDNSETGPVIGNGQAAILVDVLRGEENVIARNTINTGWEAGIHVKNSQNLVVGGSVEDANTITGRGAGSSDVGVLVQNSDGNASDGAAVEVSHNTITDTGSHGVYIDGSDYALVKVNEINGVGGNGILVNPSEHVEVIENFITDTGEAGVKIDAGSHHALVNNNDITNAGTNGVEVQPADDVEVSQNTIEGGNVGVFVLGADRTSILNNYIFGQRNTTAQGLYEGGHGTGDGIMVKNLAGDNPEDLLIQYNRIEDTDDESIQIHKGVNVRILDNTLNNSATGPIVGNGQAAILVDVLRGEENVIARNTIRTGWEAGIDVRNSQNLVIGGSMADANTITGRGAASSDVGVVVRNSDGNAIDGAAVEVSHNIISNTGSHGVYISGSDYALVTANTITNAGGNGVLVNPSNNVEVSLNKIYDAGLNGIRVEGGEKHNIHNNTVEGAGEHGISLKATTYSDVRNNVISHVGMDGINVEDFGTAWIAYNDIEYTGDDGIEANNGDFVSIYDNYIDLAGYIQGKYGNIEVGEDANGIYVENVNGAQDLPLSPTDEIGFGYGLYGADVEIYGNDVANVEDDGIQVKTTEVEEEIDDKVIRTALIVDNDESSAYIAYNTVGHVGDDGIDVDDVDVTIVKRNAVTLAGDKGITIDGGNYAGVFRNRVLLTGNDGIQVENIRYNLDLDFQVLGDEDYGYGWAVNVSGNEVAMTGDDGIEVRRSDATKVARNDVFMAGMGGGLGEVIDTVNSFANGTFLLPAFAGTLSVATVDPESFNFDWGWGDAHGINVHDIGGEYYSPNGWAVDIRNNDVKWTGGHGIRAVNNERTRIKNNDVKYAGIDETTFRGAINFEDMINQGPFSRYNLGRRNLWWGQGRMINDVLESYFGNEEPQPEYTPYITVDNVQFDNHDGIHVEEIYGGYDDGLYGGNYLFDLIIKDNDVRITGDDGIEVIYAGRTRITENTIRDAGQGDSVDYGAGDYYGADGIHVRGVTADVQGDSNPRGAGLDDVQEPEAEEGYNYEPRRNYALIIDKNDIRRTGDDGIEVVGEAGEIEPPRVPREEKTKDAKQGIYDDYGFGGSYYGTTDRVLISENTIRDAGVVNNQEANDNPAVERFGDYGFGDYGFGLNLGEDGFGHDGIHVRNVGGTVYADISQKPGPGGSYQSGEGLSFTGYAVDIIDNDVRRTADDGIEVYNSESTLITENTVRDAGTGTVTCEGEECGPEESVLYGGADYYGADGIHVRNVGGSRPDYNGSNYAGDDFEPYSVAIVNNDVRRTADDGIEVVGERVEENNEWDDYGFATQSASLSGGWSDYGFKYEGTGRTLILGNTVRDAGVSGEHGSSYRQSYDSRTGEYVYNDYQYGTKGSYDGYGGDGIHVRGVGVEFDYVRDVQVQTVVTSGGYYGNGDYAVQIINNDVRRTGDDGIEVIGTTNDECCDYGFSQESFGRVLIENNFVKNAGLAGGSYSYEYDSYNGRDEEGYYNGYNDYNSSSYYGNAGSDGYGADGIHVRGIGGESQDNPWTMATRQGPTPEGYYGYAVDIIDNDVRKTADDGIEVRNSDSTFIAWNDVKNAGELSSSRSTYHSRRRNASDSETGFYDNNYFSSGRSTWSGSNGEGSDTGGDAIHVENVGGINSEGPVMRAAGAGLGSGVGFEEYDVVVYDNDVRNSADDGVEVLYSGRTRIEDNKVVNSGISYESSIGAYISTEEPGSSSYAEIITRNSNGAIAYDGRGGDGIYVGGVYHETDGNYEPVGDGESAGNAGFLFGNFENSLPTDSVQIVGNRVRNSADDGIQVEDSGDTLIDDNNVKNSGTAESYGDYGFGDYGFASASPSVVTDEEEPFIDYGFYSYEEYGATDATGGDGINVSRDRIRGRKGPVPLALALDDSEDYEYDIDETNIRILNNKVTNSEDDGVEVVGSLDGFGDYGFGDYGFSMDVTNVLVDSNDITNSGDNGIALITTNPFGSLYDDGPFPPRPTASGISLVTPYGNSIMNSEITNNEVTDSGNNGLHVEGYRHKDVIVSGNTFTDNPTGARFESGAVDLTGETNRFIVTPGFELPEDFDFVTGLQFELAGAVSDPTSLTIVDETLGSTLFSGFNTRGVGNEFYVRFEDGAILDEFGNVIVIDGTDSNFDGIVPGAFPNEQLPVSTLAFIEDRLFDADDPAVDGRGQIFVGNPLLGIDNVEDFFRNLDPFDGGNSGLSITVTGLPPINTPAGGFGGITPAAGDEAEDVANIEPAAGEEEGTTNPQDIEPAAGGEDAACWGDVVSAAGQGGVVNYSFGGTFEESVSDVATCGSDTI